MKTTIAFLLATAGVLAAEERKDWTAWQWEASYEFRAGGMMRLEVPPAVLDLSRPDLGDLRLLSPTGAETPYLVDLPRPRQGGVRDAANFKVVLAGRNTVIDVDPGIPGAIEGIELVSPAREFLKSVSIEDGKVNEALGKFATNEVIFRQQGGAERLRIALPAGHRESLRITVNDERSLPVPFTGVRMLVAAETPALDSVPVVLGAREEASGETRLTLDLGARNLNVAELRFEIPDAVFSRTCAVKFSTIQADGESRMESLSSGVLYRVVGDRGTSAELLKIPVNRRISARYLVANFSNGDSPPLAITGASVAIYPTVLGFFAPQAGEYRLLVGNRGATPPAYDLDSLRGVLAPAGGRYPTPARLTAKADFQKPPALPGVEAAAAKIDLTGWTHRRKVDTAPSGVIRIELDAPVMAGCQSGLGDLRLIQNGRQVPYLIKPVPLVRELAPTLSLLPQDPKHPTVSQWEVLLPVEGLPVIELTASSPAAMFVRHFEALADHKDELGNSWVETIGSADWVKSQGHDTSLKLDLGGRRVPRMIRLQTDHGDNPPITVENPHVRFAAPVIVAKPTENAPLFLVYGNPKATAPQYDLRLVERELMAAETQPASLSEEEALGPDRPRKISADAGSPWFWVALGGVVIALLVVVAKLLPKPAAQ